MKKQVQSLILSDACASQTPKKLQDVPDAKILSAILACRLQWWCPSLSYEMKDSAGLFLLYNTPTPLLLPLSVPLLRHVLGFWVFCHSFTNKSMPKLNMSFPSPTSLTRRRVLPPLKVSTQRNGGIWVIF